MRWGDLEAAQPRLAAVARERLLGPGVALVATLRRDGTPRVSPVEPFLLDGDLELSMLEGSRKAADLHRDPRLLIHSIVTDRSAEEGELKLRGTAAGVEEAAAQERYAAAVADVLGWRPVPGRFQLFRVEVDDVVLVRYDSATGDQTTTRWPRGGEHVRRGTTPTSLGPPQPVHLLLDD